MAVVSAGEARADLLRACRIHEARIAAGVEEVESEESEAGALLMAESTAELHVIAEIAKAWAKAQRS